MTFKQYLAGTSGYALGYIHGGHRTGAKWGAAAYKYSGKQVNSLLKWHQPNQTNASESSRQRQRSFMERNERRVQALNLVVNVLSFALVTIQVLMAVTMTGNSCR